MTTDLDNMIEYYKDLLLYQYINASRARATIGLLVTQALVDDLPIEMQDSFDVDTAIGPQLDIIGEYVGLSRLYLGQDDTEYRKVIYLKIILNTSNNTTASINDFLTKFFLNALICLDQEDMTIVYFVIDANNTLMELAYANNLIPKPMGVTISGIFSVPDVRKLFAFSTYLYDNGFTIGFSDYVTGYLDGHWLDYQDRIA